METLIDKKQLSDLLKVSIKTIDNMLAKNTGPQPLRIGRLVRFKQADVQDFIQRLQRGER